MDHHSNPLKKLNLDSYGVQFTHAIPANDPNEPDNLRFRLLTILKLAENNLHHEQVTQLKQKIYGVFT